MNQLAYQRNPFEGAVIIGEDIGGDAGDFGLKLRQTIDEIKSQNLRVIWLEIPIEKSDLIPQAVDAGFIFHHALEDRLQLTLTLIEGSYVPPFATHYIGAGGVVIDSENRILVIQEKYRHNKRRHYKLPGGTLHQGEHIEEAVVREVEEETGIKTRFVSLACFRHWHGYRYGKSDIYFVCRLEPLTTEITIDESEIEEALWMPLEEYLASPDTHDFNRKIVKTAVSGKGLAPEGIDGYGTPETHEMMFVTEDPSASPESRTR